MVLEKIIQIPPFTITGKMNKQFLIMGVTGSGKTTIARHLARKLKVLFIEGDDYHSIESKKKMMLGIGINNIERSEWIRKICDLVYHLDKNNYDFVLACSALKEIHRSMLLSSAPNLKICWLELDTDDLNIRLKKRKHHFASRELLASQLVSLESPNDDVKFTNTGSIDSVIEQITEKYL